MRDTFTVWNRQVTVNSIDIVKRGRGILIAEIDFKHKYPEVLAYGGEELLVHASAATREDSYDKAAMPTVIHLPERCRYWDVLPEHSGRYTIRVALYKSGRRRFSYINTEERQCSVT